MGFLLKNYSCSGTDYFNFISVHVVCASAHTPECFCESQRLASVLCHSPSWFWEQDLHWAWNSLLQPDWLVSEPSDPTCLYLPLELDLQTCTLLSRECQGSKPRPSWLCNTHCAQLAASLALMDGFLKRCENKGWEVWREAFLRLAMWQLAVFAWHTWGLPYDS